VSTPLAAGEFFGVKSALGRYIREETAFAVDDTAVIVFTIPEFEQFAMTNTHIVMKMLKVFSHQLQLVHRQLAELTGGDEPRPDAGLFRVGEYYLEGKHYSQARYVFNRYLTYYPAGKYADAAMEKLRNLEEALAGKGDVREPAGQVPAPAAKPPVLPGEGAKEYYEALSLLSQEKYDRAYAAFKKISDSPDNPDYAAKSAYEMGRCLFFLGKFKYCIEYYTNMLSQYPQHSNLCGIYYVMGQAYEKSGDKKNAALFYRETLSLPAGDEAVMIKAKQALRGLGV
jgi:TolA-binding protein